MMALNRAQQAMNIHYCLYCGHHQRVSRSHRHFQTVLRGQRGQRGQGPSSAVQGRYGSTAWPYKPPLENNNAKYFPFTTLLAQNLPCSCPAQCGASCAKPAPCQCWWQCHLCLQSPRSSRTITSHVHPWWHNWGALSLLSPLSHLSVTYIILFRYQMTDWGVVRSWTTLHNNITT